MPDLLTLDLDPDLLRLAALLTACDALVPPGYGFAVGHGLCIVRTAHPWHAWSPWHIADLEANVCVFVVTMDAYGPIVAYDQPGAWEARLLAWADEKQARP